MINQQIPTNALVLLAIMALFVGLVVWGFNSLENTRLQRLQFREEAEARREERELKKAELEAKREGDIKRDLVEAERRAREIELAEQKATDESLRRWKMDQAAEAAKDKEATSGYIFLYLPDTERPFFHDLLMGFEDYARIRGYNLSFSIEASQTDRVGFKFTVRDGDAVVSQTRVRDDFKVYLEKVRGGDPEAFNQIPTIIPAEEHGAFMQALLQRFRFIEEKYQESEAAQRLFTKLIRINEEVKALPSTTNVIVQTGGSMDSTSYKVGNAQRMIQGNNNVFNDSSLNIGKSLIERTELVSDIEQLIGTLHKMDETSSQTHEAAVELSKAKDDLKESTEPDPSRLEKYFQKAKTLLSGASLSAEAFELAHKLFSDLGLSS